MEQTPPKEPIATSDLCDITRGLQEAASATTGLIAQQYIKLFDQFFDYDSQALGAPMKAKMVEVAMDDRHTLKIPLIALVAPRGLALERMQVDLSVKIQNTRSSSEETTAERDRRLYRECQGRPNSGACAGYAYPASGRRR